MLAIITICFVILIGEINCVFVELGEYPDHPRVNEPECGLSREVRFTPISFNPKCFLNKYPNKTLYIVRPKRRVLTNGRLSNFGAVQSRMLNGREVQIEEAPWTVFISVDHEPLRPSVYGHVRPWFFPRLVRNTTRKDEQRTCTGALITLEWVITSASCFYNIFQGHEVNYISVYAGTNIGGSAGSSLVISRYTRYQYRLIQNPELFAGYWHQYRDADIALFNLFHKFTRTVNSEGFYTINTICLPKASNEWNSDNKKEGKEFGNKDYDWAHFTGFGFGKSQWITSWSSVMEPLRWQDFHLMPQNKCNPVARQMCAKGNSNRDSCPGDTGGPLFQFSKYIEPTRAIHIGVLGETDQFCRPRDTLIKWFPTMAVINWILETIKNYKHY